MFRGINLDACTFLRLPADSARDAAHSEHGVDSAVNDRMAKTWKG